jgi:CDP-paratose 2-epimerase
MAEASTAVSRILVTGGAGFVGSNLSVALAARYPDRKVIAYDNFSRTGSALNVPRLEAAGAEVVKGDVRDAAAILSLEGIGLIIDCAAEPSVMAGHAGSGVEPRDLVDINFGGTLNCLELARRSGASVLFLSTSRVYPIKAVNDLPFVEKETRFDLEEPREGASSEGISESFTLEGARSLYGATKLCSEQIIAEYASMYGIKTAVTRSGVIAGPWQFGKSDQGIVSLWVARHLFKTKPLSYIGFGGAGKQVRDVLHVSDLIDAMLWQIEHLEECAGRTFQLGGGRQNAVSLQELTALCQQVTGNVLPISSDQETRPGDIRWYVSDHSRFTSASGWTPQRSVERIVADTHQWMQEHLEEVGKILA